MNSAPSRRLLTRYSEAVLPTEFGTFRMVVFREASGAEHVALVRGEPRDGEEVLVRVHSECLTGEVFHSLKCDCAEQLRLALTKLGAAPCGVLVYLRQEGRGIGLGNKVRAYALQDGGLDTVDANRALGFADDARGYDAAIEILHELGVRNVALLTNNPHKVEALTAGGIAVPRRVDHSVPLHSGNRDYLTTKRERMGHLGEDSGASGNKDEAAE